MMEISQKKSQSSVKEVAIEFCNSTTVHGLQFLTDLGNRWLQLFWFWVVLIGFVGLSVHLYNIINVFLEYKTTEYSYERNDGYNFPDVTICNLNGVSSSNLESLAMKSPEAKYFLDTNGNPDKAKILSVNDLFWALGDHTLEAGHSLSDFVLRCRFQGQQCNLTTDFVLFQFSRFFNCYTFKVGRSEQTIITQGIAAGLSLTLFLEPVNTNIRKKYDDKIVVDNIDGVRVALTPPNSLAAVGVMGYDILPGHATSIGFDITEHERLSEPYSTCRGVDSMSLEDNLTYSFTECKNMCIHKHVTGECGCFPTRYVVRKDYTTSNISSCANDIFTEPAITKKMLDCQTTHLQNIETGLDYAQDCNCHSSCEDTKYSVTISQSEFPSQNSIFSFWDVVLEDHPNRESIKAYNYYKSLQQQNVSTDELKAWTRQHFLRLNIYANSKTVFVTEEIPMYTPVDLMSQIGGCLGLWLGISIITVVEFFDLAFRLIHLLLKKINGSMNNAPTS